MRDVNHTHPYADQGALDRLFERGPVVAADGGERDARDETEARPDESADAREEDEESGDEQEQTQMKDVDHTPPHGDGVDRVFDRGGEREHERVESEE